MPIFSDAALPCGFDDPETMAVKAAKLRIEHQAEYLERKRLAMIPSRYLDAKPDSGYFDCVYRQHLSLLLFGDVGSGKTYQACGICNSLMRQGINCTFIAVSGLLRLLRSSFDGEISEVEAMSGLEGVSVLAIDDLGKENPTAWATEHIFEILDCRASNGKQTIITTNLTAEQILNRYGESGEAILSRLMDTAKTVHFTGKDRRLERAKDIH